MREPSPKLPSLEPVRATFAAGGLIMLLAAGCASPPSAPDQEADEAGDQPAQDQPVSLSTIDKRALSRRSEKALRKIVSGAKSYFVSAQSNCHGAPDCSAPWHDFPGEDAGSPIHFKNYTFPGGTDQRVATMPEIPQGGRMLVVQLEADKYEDETLRLLNLSRADDAEPVTSPFRYTYSTNGERGKDAEAVVRAEADFDPQSPEHHTVTVRLSIDPDNYELQIEGPTTEHAFE